MGYVVAKIILCSRSCSDGWAVRPDVVADIENFAMGGISMKLYSPPITDFDQYYFALNPYNNEKNPWFNEFWQQKFNCRLDVADADTAYDTPCTGEIHQPIK